jgi:hypothetical protein
MSNAPSSVSVQIQRLKDAITELEQVAWDSGNARVGRELRSAAKRIVLESRLLEQQVSENTYHTGGV